MSRLRALLAALLVFGWSGAAWPHAGSNAYLFVSAAGAEVSTRGDFAVRDLDELFGLDGDGDGRVTWAEVEAARRGIEEYARTHLRLKANGHSCDAVIAAGPLQAVEHTDGWYAVVQLRDRCPAGAVQVEYSALVDLDASHRAQVRVDSGGSVAATLLTPDRRSFELRGAEGAASEQSTFRVYLLSGMHHVLGGLDHLLFLVGLFLPAALRRVRGGWEPLPNLRTALTESGTIVTAFTLAHALTLCVVALGLFAPPTRLVECLVALSVAFAGFNNLVPVVHQRYLAGLAGAFGLVHGAAVAGALIDLGLPTGSRVLALLGFNLGVEIAQLLPVMISVLLTWPLRESPGYRRGVLIPGSVLVTLFGLMWLVTRMLGIKPPV